MSEKATKHQKAVFDKVTDDGHTCPKCYSEGGQYLQIENKGESWTQIRCSYCREYINLDEYNKLK
tara:strand:+ start:389 stop:583 length:195 start_codon:yes stop_codon:yes gene_type:complete